MDMMLNDAGSRLVDWGRRMSLHLKRRHVMAREFLSFAAVGTFGYLVDASVLTLALFAGLGFYAGRAVSFMVAVTFTWYCNRKFTFEPSGEVSAFQQFIRFVSWNALGGAVNLGVYALLIGYGGIFVRMPFLAVAAGSLAGLAVNFLVSKYFVFGRKRVLE